MQGAGIMHSPALERSLLQAGPDARERLEPVSRDVLGHRAASRVAMPEAYCRGPTGANAPVNSRADFVEALIGRHAAKLVLAEGRAGSQQRIAPNCIWQRALICAQHRRGGGGGG
jgi:hypothetical protein